MSAGMGLIPFWSCDISGYCGDITDYDSFKELYIRWLQFGAFNPLSRIHHEGNNAVEPWLFDDETEKICKSAIELKYQLFPYIYTYAREAYDKGWPIIRALMLEYPDDEQTVNLNSEFFFGSELLVAPVTEEGAAFKKVYLPKGEWIDFNDKKTVYEGKQWINYPVTISKIPVFVKKGAIIPMMPVMQYIFEKPAHPLILEIFPANDNHSATFDLYEDDGETNNYKKDIYCRTNIECDSKEKEYNLKINERESRGYAPPGERNYWIKLHLDQKPSGVLSGSEKLKSGKAEKIAASLNNDFSSSDWYWDKDLQTCFIKVPDKGKMIEITIIK